jgi:hypothetical protein
MGRVSRYKKHKSTDMGLKPTMDGYNLAPDVVRLFCFAKRAVVKANNALSGYRQGSEKTEATKATQANDC